MHIYFQHVIAEARLLRHLVSRRFTCATFFILRGINRNKFATFFSKPGVFESVRGILGNLRWSAGSFTLGDFRRGAARRAVPRRARRGRVGVSVAFHPATALRAMRAARTVPDPIAHPPRRRVLAHRVSRWWCQSRSVRRARTPFVCRPAIVHPPSNSFRRQRDMPGVDSARSWTRDRVARHGPGRRAM